MSQKRSFNAGRFAFLLDGVNVGFCKSVSGGQIKGIIGEHDAGPSPFKRKHIANLSHEPFTVEVSSSMGRELQDWMTSSLKQGHYTRSGQISSLNFDGEEMRVMEFFDAHIVEIGWPKLAGSEKSPVYLTLKIDPERLRHRKGSGAKVKGEFGGNHKKWLANNWRFDMSGLPTERVSAIDAITVKCTTVKDELGAFKEPIKVPGKIEIPNITWYVSMADHDEYERVFEKFVIQGMNDQSQEMQGSITLLDQSLKNELCTMELRGCGLMELEAEKHEASSEKISALKVTSYCEEIDIKLQPGQTDA